MTSDYWTPERIEALKVLWLTHASAGQIADQLGGGVTRSAVCGKANRLGLVKPERPSQPGSRAYSKEPKPRPVREPKPPRAPRPMQRTVNPLRLKPMPAAPIASTVVASTFARPWVERKVGQCAYPISGAGADVWSCCAATDATYCDGHAAIMFVKPAEAGSRYARSLRRWAA